MSGTKQNPQEPHQHSFDGWHHVIPDEGPRRRQRTLPPKNPSSANEANVENSPQWENSSAGTEALTVAPPPTGPERYRDFKNFSSIAGFTILTYFKERADHEFLLRVARKMEIPPSHAEAVINYVHSGRPPPPSEQAPTPIMILSEVRRRAVTLFREGQEQIGVQGVAGTLAARTAQEIVSWRGDENGSEVALVTLREVPSDDKTW